MFDRQARLALIVAALVLASSSVGFRYVVGATNRYLEKLPVDLRDELVNIPRRLGDWRALGPDRALTAEIEEVLGTKQYLDRVYERAVPGAPPVALNVQVTYYTGLIDAVPHIPDRCTVAGGWVPEMRLENMDLHVDRTAWDVDRRVNRRTGRAYPLLTYRHPITGQPVTVRLPVGDLELRTGTFRHPRQTDLRQLSGYFFLANGEITPSTTEVRRFAFDLTTRYAYYAKVQLNLLADDATERERFVAEASDLLDDLLPELMRCLPDWADVESRDHVDPGPGGTEK